MQSVTSARAVGMFTMMLLISVSVYSSREICETLVLNVTTKMKKKPMTIFKFIRFRRSREMKLVLG